MLRAAWPWVRAAVVGAVIAAVVSEIGYGSFTLALLPGAFIVGSLAGLTVRGVRVARGWLGPITAWTGAAVVWGAMVWGFLAVTPECPLQSGGGRCDGAVAATWGVNVMLAVLVVLLIVEPPRQLWRAVRAAWRRARRGGGEIAGNDESPERSGPRPGAGRSRRGRARGRQRMQRESRRRNRRG